MSNFITLFQGFERLWLVAALCLAVDGSATAQFVTSATNADINIPASPLHHGAIGLGTWNSTAEFKDIVVTASDGAVLYRSEFEKEGTTGWTVFRGSWGVKDGVLQETAVRQQCRAAFGDTNWDNYTITLRARKTGGAEGFVVYFNSLDPNNWTYFNVGGWTNTWAGVESQIDGGPWTFLCDRTPCSIETNVWYDVRVVLQGDRIECYLDSKLVQAAAYSPPARVSSEAAAGNSAGAAAQTPTTLLKKFPLFTPILHGAIGVGARNSRVEFTNIVVTRNNTVLYRSDFSKPNAADAWFPSSGNWSVTGGVFRQSQIAEDCLATHGETNWANYTLPLQTRKLDGAEGFHVAFGWLDDDNYMVFSAGGHGNQSAVIEENIRGRHFTMTREAPLVIESNVWYDVKVVLSGVRVACYVNSNLIQTATAQLPFATNAVFEGASTGPEGQVLQFRVGHQTFTASLRRDRGWPVSLEPGSLVQVTGQIELEPEQNLDGRCDVELFSPDDVVLLQVPSWWTWRRILGVGGVFLAVLIVVTVWVAMIWRKNRLLTLAQHQLKTANDELELRVGRRTAELAKANGELKHEQALFRALLDSASDFIYFKDRKSRFVRCGVALCHRSALSHEQIIGKTDFDIFQDEHARRAFDDEQAIIRTGTPLIGQTEKEVHPDGRVTWVLTTKMPWHGPDGNIIGTLGISRDVTAIKEAEMELERAHKQLVEASRAAGMAEVATGVLHNVGNVLNSVNVSASLVIDKAKQTQLPSLVRLVALLSDHSADLSAFLVNDPKGRQVPAFLNLLATQLTSEQKNTVGELELLCQNINHIKEIVAMQQAYATVSGVSTVVEVTELIEDLLRLTEAGFKRHGIKLMKEIAPFLPNVTVDRHKVLQILVNVVRNAKRACEDSQRPDPQVTISATAAGDRIKISVADNGVGIPAENFTRIFAHGFTTRKDGHGFGLHSSALAAREIRGHLLVHSEGPGKGATFTLELDPGFKTDRERISQETGSVNSKVLTFGLAKSEQVS